MASLEAQVNEVLARSDDLIWRNKLDEYKKGLAEVEAEYDDRYTEEARREAIETYKTNALQSINEELEAFDTKSRAINEQVGAELEKAIAQSEINVYPQTDFEFQKLAYMERDISNELAITFHDSELSTRKFEQLLTRAKYNDMYALALANTRSELINRIRDNQEAKEERKSSIISFVNSECERLQTQIMPPSYKKNIELKEEFDNAYLNASRKQRMFNLVMNKVV